MQAACSDDRAVVVGLDLSSTSDQAGVAVWDGQAWRGSGLTSAQLSALPDGSAYLVHSTDFANYCRKLLVHLGRSHDAITFLTPDGYDRAITGRRWRAYDVDHAYYRLTGRRGWKARNYLAMACASPPRSA